MKSYFRISVTRGKFAALFHKKLVGDTVLDPPCNCLRVLHDRFNHISTFYSDNSSFLYFWLATKISVGG